MAFIDICHRIKEKYSHLPAIALSCNININERYAQQGFDAYIQKPFDLELLYKVLRDYLPMSSISLDKIKRQDGSGSSADPYTLGA